MRKTTLIGLLLLAFCAVCRYWSPAAEQRNSFFVSLLVLSSAVIRADGNNDIYCL